MRIKAGIILIVLAALIGISGCMNQEKGFLEKAADPEIGTVQQSEKSIPEQDAPVTAIPGETRTAQDKGDDSITETGGANTVASPEENSLFQQENQVKISITGAGIKAGSEITLNELKQMDDILVSANYFSRGTEKPGWSKTAHTEFKGVLLYELLADHAGMNAEASQVQIIAEDGYTQVFSIEDIKADYSDETEENKKLRMIIAWEQDGREYDSSQGNPFCLVMGQQFPGDYNRQKWVNNIISIVVE